MPETWQRLTIVIHSLTGGGSEHTAASMADYWAEAGREVVLLTLDSIENDQIEVSPRVSRIGLGMMRESTGLCSAILANRARIKSLRNTLIQSRPDRVISLTDRTSILTLLATRRTGLPVIVSERTDVRHHRIGRIWEWLRKRIYPSASSIVVQTARVQAAVRRFAGSTPVHVIPNSVPLQTDCVMNSIPGLNSQRKWFVAVGRLSFEKGFDRLIDAFGQIAGDLPDWNLALIGDGPEKKRLQNAAKQHNVADRILMPGWIEKPWSAVPDSAIAVLPSRYEGFPNVLLEAMSQGLATIAFDCDSGPAEIIRHDVDGILVADGDISALASAMHSMAIHPDEQNRLSSAATNVNERFSPASIFTRWEAVLNDC